MASLENSPTERVDKWLWAARLFKTRSLALTACRAGHVKIDGAVVKPARNLRPGEKVEVFANDLNRILRVVGFSEMRVGPKRVTELYEDLTAPEEWERKRESLAARVLSRPRGGGRPTKRDRRKLDEFFP